MVKYALSMALILLLGTCGDRGAGPDKTGRIALDVQDPATPDEVSGTVVQGVDRMVVTVLQDETVVMSEDLRYEGDVWLGELTVTTGSYSVVVEAYKGAFVKWRGSALVLVQGGKSSRVVIALTSTNQVPVLADIGDQTIAEGRTLTILLVGSDADGDALTYAVGGAPAGATLSGSTFTWEPSHTQAGEYSVTFTVTDQHGGVARETVTITVGEANQAPTLAAIGDQTVAEGSLLTIPLVGTDEDGDALTYAVEGPPAGATLSGSTFTWEPSHTQAGEYSVTFTVADQHGGVAREIIIITVAETNQAPELADVGNQNADVGKVLTIILEGSDADGDALTDSVEGQPTGASLAEQTFSWKPSSAQVGTYEVTFTVEDGRGGSDSQNVTINVEGNQIPELASIGPHIAEEGSALTIILEGSDADGDALTYSVEGQPTGASLAEQTFSWTPSYSQSGEYEVTFTVEDDRGGVDRETITITVKNTNREPELATIGDQTVAGGHTLTITLAGNDADGDVLIFTVENNPSGSSLSGTTFTWQPSDTEGGMYQVTFRVEDEHGGQAVETIVITVKSRLRRLTNHDAWDAFPSWSPDGTQIAFQSTRDGNWEIYVMDADGNNLRRLTNYDDSDVSPSWSPDGTQITFSSHRDGNWNIYVMDADGSNLRRLTRGVYPSWSPDGTQIAFQSNRDGNWNIYVVYIDGSNPRQLTSHSSWSPSWSPDGTQIAFYATYQEDAEIYVMDTDGKNLRQLTQLFSTDAFPSWSPDGTQIAFQSTRDGDEDIYVMDADGSNPRRLTSYNGADRSPSWSPDGTQIAFESNRDGNDEIYVLDLQWE